VSINATLLAQMVVFALLIGFTMRYIWPILLTAMVERETRIADGLAAAERGRHELELADKAAGDKLRDAKQHAQEYIVQAQKRADELVEEAKQQARVEAERILIAARAEIEQESNQAREQLRADVAALVVAGAERILLKEIDVDAHRDLLKKLAADL
jgi:F-type H+-transporting ATPase subunit b